MPNPTQNSRVPLLARQVLAHSPVWMMRPDREAALLESLIDVTAFWWDSDDEPDAPAYDVVNGVAVVPVHGVLIDSEPAWWHSWLGYQSLSQLAGWVEDALADGNVDSVLLHVDSPGGQASGVSPVEDAVFSVRGQKPIVAYCKDACSLAYRIASQAERVYIAKDGYSGCLGTVSVVADYSRQLNERGITVYRITSDGAETYKGAGAHGTELTEAQRADFKRICNEHQALFNEALVRGRGFTSEQLPALTDGRYYVGQVGVGLGLCDRVATLAEVLATLGAGSVDIDEGEDPPPSPTGDTTDPGMRRGERTEPMNKSFWDKFKALAKTEGVDLEEGQKPDSTASALSSAEKAELETLRAFRDKQMEAGRIAATACAVKAFGAGSDRLEAAKKAIAAAPSLEDLDGLQTVYTAQIPTALTTATGAQTQAELPKEAEQSIEEKTAFYAELRAKAEANFTGAGKGGK